MSEYYEYIKRKSIINSINAEFDDPTRYICVDDETLELKEYDKNV